MSITEYLFAMRDENYRSFSSRLIPNISSDKVIGVRIPHIRKLAKELIKSGEYENFINQLPHEYIEEYHLHSFLISEIKDFDICTVEVEKLLPYIDNWSVCDSLRPKCFYKNRDKLLVKIKKWIKSEHPYTVRFAIEMLMVHYLDEDFSVEYLDLASGVCTDDYYLKMMVAWYFATALAKQYEKTVTYIEAHSINDRWTHNKAIQKALESFRISEERKSYLKELKR